MAKKRKRTGKREHDRRGRQDSAMPDRRVFEGAMRELVSRLGGEAGELTASDRAEEVIYEAFEASGAERVRLARRALEISADCADAYVLLAEHASSPDEARKLYEQGVAAGERRTGQAGLCGTRRPFLGHIGNPPVHAGTRGPGPFSVGGRPKARGGRALSRAALAQPRRQPGRTATVWPPYFWTWTARTSSRGSWPTTTTRPRRCGHTARPCWHSASGATAQRPASCSPRPGRSTSTCPPTCSGTSNCRTSSPLTSVRAETMRPSATRSAIVAPGSIRRAKSRGCERRSTRSCPSRRSAGGLPGPN